MKKTNADRVMEVLQKDGFITNFYAMKEMYILSLAAVIHELQKEGRIIIDKEKSGFVGKSKNYKYVALPAEMMRATEKEEIKKQPIQKVKTQEKKCDKESCLCHKAAGMKTKIKHLNCLFCGCSRMIMPSK